jgi:hypothetical protein
LQQPQRNSFAHLFAVSRAGDVATAVAFDLIVREKEDGAIAGWLFVIV